MKLKLSQYRKAHEAFVKKQYLKEGIDSISFYCSVSFCPVLAAYWFCREVDSENLELTRRIESVKLFYGVTEVEE